ELGKGLDRGWYFPAGAVEPGESLFDAARREALEETGIDVEPAYVLRIDHGYFPSAPDTPWWRFVIVAHPVSNTAPAATEPGIQAIEWISPDKLADLPLRAPDAEAIMRAHLDVKTGRNSPSYHFSPDGTLAGFFH